MIRILAKLLTFSRTVWALHDWLSLRGNRPRDAGIRLSIATSRLVAPAALFASIVTGTLPWNWDALAQDAAPQLQVRDHQNSSSQQPVAETPRARMSQELNRLASICGRLELDDEEAISRNWLQNARPDQRRFYLPVELPGVGSQPESARWREHFIQARKDYAASLFDAARMAAEGGDEARAFRLLWQVLREDPNHALAGKILGPLPESIHSKPQRRSSRNPMELPGLGPVSRWQSRHFDVISRASVPATVRLITQLEQIYSLFTQIFYDFWATKGVLDARFANRNSPWPDRQRLTVVLFADRNEYLQTLGVAESNIGVSVGYYNSVKQTSFFYDCENHFETVVHELTHQFLAEACNFLEPSNALTRTNAEGSRSQVRLDQVSGAWAIEGIALYIESLSPTAEGWTLGGVDSPRMQAARYRAVRDQYWPNWSDFTQASIAQWKDRQDIAILYSHAAGLTHVFFDLHPTESMAGEALERYLASIYQGTPDADELWKVLGSSDAIASAKYREVMTVNDSQLDAMAAGNPLNIRELVLSRSQLSSWRALAAFSNLEWLDLSYSNFDSEDVVALDGLKHVRRLSLEGIDLDAPAIEQISKLTSVEELDLSECGVDDEKLRLLAGHPRLRILWLSQNEITDRALETLGSLPSLRRCEISQNRITPDAWKEFSDLHPELNSQTP